MTNPIQSVGLVPASSLEELMERATETRGPVRLESAGAVGPTVDRALLAYDRSRALSSRVALFAPRVIPGAAREIPEGDPIEERPISVPGGSDEPMATGGAGESGPREATIEVNGRSFPVVITHGDQAAPEGYVAVRTEGSQTLWAPSGVASELSTAITNARDGFTIAESH
jgi:hypothetical protein